MHKHDLRKGSVCAPACGRRARPRTNSHAQASHYITHITLPTRYVVERKYCPLPRSHCPLVTVVAAYNCCFAPSRPGEYDALHPESEWPTMALLNAQLRIFTSVRHNFSIELHAGDKRVTSRRPLCASETGCTTFTVHCCRI